MSPCADVTESSLCVNCLIMSFFLAQPFLMSDGPSVIGWLQFLSLTIFLHSLPSCAFSLQFPSTPAFLMSLFTQSSHLPLLLLPSSMVKGTVRWYIVGDDVIACCSAAIMSPYKKLSTCHSYSDSNDPSIISRPSDVSRNGFGGVHSNHLSPFIAV